MMQRLACSILFLLFASLTLAAPEVEIATERDAKGKFTNSTVLTVDWEMETDGVAYKEYAEAEVPDHYSTESDWLQEWYVPKPQADTYWKFTFIRKVKGEYAVRWRPEPDSLWSEWESCTIEQPRPPKQGG